MYDGLKKRLDIKSYFTAFLLFRDTVHIIVKASGWVAAGAGCERLGVGSEYC